MAEVPERGARIARRETRECREHLSVEQRSEAGCPARELCDESRFLGTSRAGLVTGTVTDSEQLQDGRRENGWARRARANTAGALRFGLWP